MTNQNAQFLNQIFGIQRNAAQLNDLGAQIAGALAGLSQIQAAVAGSNDPDTDGVAYITSQITATQSNLKAIAAQYNVNLPAPVAPSAPS